MARGIALSLLLASLLSARGGLAAPSRVLLLTSPMESISASSFALALRLQLQPFGLELEQASWSPPEGFAKQRDGAAAVARRAGHSLVAWHVVRGLPSGESELLAFLSDLSTARRGTRFIALAGTGSGIERSMASALATLIVATVRGEPVRPGRPLETVPAAPARPERASPEAKNPRPGARATSPALRRTNVANARQRLHLLGTYGVDVLPVGAELRHGPVGSLALRVSRELAIEIGAGWRAAGSGSDGATQWSRSTVDVRCAMEYEWPLRAGRLAFALGAALRISAVQARAGSDGRTEAATLWELGLGPRVGLFVRIHPYLSLVAHFLAGWVPVGHQLVVGGQEVGRPGGAEISLASGLRLALW